MTQTSFAVFFCAAAAIADQARFADDQARGLVEKSRAAVAAGVSARPLRSLIFKGRLRVPDRDDSTDGTVEIRILLPDRFLRIDDIGGKARRSMARSQFTTLLLGALAIVPADQRLTVRSTGEQGFADTIALDVSGSSYSVRLVLDATSHIPLRVVSFGEPSTSTVISFANRRTVDGYELPFRVTTQTPDRVLETLMFDEILVNPELRESDFR